MPEAMDSVRIGIVSVSDRASSGVYADQGLPALQAWLTRAIRNPIEWQPRLIPDDEAGGESSSTLGRRAVSLGGEIRRPQCPGHHHDRHGG